MLIRANGARSGIKEYLERGQMKDRFFDRDQLDHRVVLQGDLNLVDDIINSYDNEGEKYFHYTLSFKEDSINQETLSAITQEFRDYYFKSYTNDELCFYAEAHLPKLKTYIERANYEVVERKPHIHVVIPKVNMLTNKSITYDEERNIKYLNAFQEYINCKYGLESPKDNMRVDFNSRSEVISRYKGDEFKGIGKEHKEKIFALMIDNKVGSREELIKLLKENQYTVKTRNAKDQSKSYLNITADGEEKGINLKEFIFSDEFLKLSDADKSSFSRYKSKVSGLTRAERLSFIATNQALSNKYVEMGAAREIPVQYIEEMAEWNDIVADQRKYVDRGNKSNRELFKEITNLEKVEKLAQIKAEYYNKIGVENYEPNSAEFAELTAIYRGTALNNLQSAGANLEVFTDHCEELGRNQVGTISRERYERYRDEYSRQVAPDSRRYINDTDYSQGHERTTVLNSVTLDYINEVVAREDLKAEVDYIKANLRADSLLELVHKTHGVLAEKYPLTVGRNGEDRIKCGDNNYSVVDFCRKEMNLNWEESIKILRSAEMMQREVDRERGWTNRDTKYLASEYKEWLKEFKAAKDTELAQLQKEVKDKFALITAEYKNRAKQVSENKELPYHARDEQKRLLKMDRILENRSLYAARNKEMEAIKTKYNLDMQESYRKFLVEKAELGDDKALFELRRLRVDFEEYQKAGSVRHVDSYKEFRLDVSHVIDAAGTITYSQDGNRIIKDIGKRLDFLTREEDHLKLGLDLAISKFGKRIELHGNEAFRKQMVELAVKSNYDITFRDAFSEGYRREYIQNLKAEHRELETANANFFKQNFTDVNGLLVTKVETVTVMNERGRVQDTNKVTLFDLNTRKEYTVSGAQVNFLANNDKIKVGDLLSIDGSAQNGIKVNPYFWGKYTGDLKQGVLISDYIRDDKLIIELPAWKQAKYNEEYFTIREEGIAAKLKSLGYEHGDLVSVVPKIDVEQKTISYDFTIIGDGQYKKEAKKEILNNDITQAKAEFAVEDNKIKKEITGKLINYGQGLYKGKESTFIMVEENSRKLSPDVLAFKEAFCEKHGVALSNLEKQNAGTVIEFGSAKYNEKAKEATNYIKLDTPTGERIVWGKDLARTIEERGIQVGDKIFVAKIGEKQVHHPAQDGKQEKMENLFVYEAEKLTEKVSNRVPELTSSLYSKYWNTEFAPLIKDNKLVIGETVYLAQTHEVKEQYTETKNNYLIKSIDLVAIRQEQALAADKIRERNHLPAESKVVAGVFNKFGEHQFDNGKSSFYIDVMDIQGSSQRIWGNELKQMIVANELKVGEGIAIAKVKNNRFDCERVENLTKTVLELNEGNKPAVNQILESDKQANNSPMTHEAEKAKESTNTPKTSNTIESTNAANMTNTPGTTKTLEFNKEISYWDSEVINQELVNNIDTVLDSVLTGKRTRVGATYRYGSKGSLAVTFSGTKAGYWHDFETDEGGKSLVTLIQREYGYNYKEALDYSAALAGLRDSDKIREIKTIQKTVEVTGFDDYQTNMIRVAQSIGAKAKSGENTLAQDYLKSRGITADLPSNIEFSPSVYIKKYEQSFPAMVVRIPNEKGETQSVHVTLLDSQDKGKAKVENAKIRFGPVPDIIDINLNSKPPTTNISYIAEGLETALSIKSAYPDSDVKAALAKAGFNRIDLDKLGSTVVLCLDNDLKDWKEDKIINDAAKRLTEAGKNVLISMPEAINGQKTDFNDVLKSKGLGGVKNSIENAEDYNQVRVRDAKVINEYIKDEKHIGDNEFDSLHYRRQRSGEVIDFGTKTIKGEKTNFIKLSTPDGKGFTYWDKNIPLANLEKGKAVFIAEKAKETVTKELTRPQFNAKVVGKDLDKRAVELVRAREVEQARRQVMSQEL